MITVKTTFDNFTTCIPCRVNYDEANWLALASVLATARDNIHPLNREQIICDVAALANTGHVSADIRDRVRHRNVDNALSPCYRCSPTSPRRRSGAPFTHTNTALPRGEDLMV